MTSYVVLTYDEDTMSKPKDKTVLVRDHFAVLAFIFPLLWLLWYRLWVHAIILLCVSTSIIMLFQSTAYWMVAMPINLLLSAFVALEGPVWRIQKFKKILYKQSGLVDADTLLDAELIWAAKTANTKTQKNDKPVLQKTKPNMKHTSYEANILFAEDGLK